MPPQLRSVSALLVSLLNASLLLPLPPPCRASYVPCEPCDPRALALCAPLPPACAAGAGRGPVVREPGCGCCPTCALRGGQPCGVYTAPCARGLRCLPANGEEKPLRALLRGRGTCRSDGGEKLAFSLPQPPGGGGVPGDATVDAPPRLFFGGGHSKVPLAAYEARGGHSKVPLAAYEARGGHSKVPLAAYEARGGHSKVPLLAYEARGGHHVGSLKVLAMRQARERSKQLARQGVSRQDGPDPKPPAAPLDKPLLQFGPCRTRLDNVIQRMRDSPQVAALSLYLPNCDKKGFYKRKQCKPSRGRKRGMCWCVDRFGVKLAGGDDLQCKELDDSAGNE